MSDQLSEFEFTLLRLALPELIKDDSIVPQIVFHYYDRFTDEQCVKLLNSLRMQELSEAWNKFLASLDRSSYYIAQTIDDRTLLVFEANNKTYSVSNYTSYPEEEVVIPIENIRASIK